MSGLSSPRKNALLLVAMLFAQLLVISGNVKKSGGASLLETGVLRASGPVVEATQAVGGGIGGFLDRVREIKNARRENATLRREVEQLRREVDQRREAALENERLRRLLEMRDQLAPRSVVASVVAANFSGQMRMLVIDRGSEDGVRPDLPVVAWGGAVGRVVFADRHLAKVRLLTDPNGGAAGLVQRTRAEGMVVGRGERPMAMLYVPAYEDVLQGDRIVTSGKDGVFPRGFTVGRVLSVGSEPGVSKPIEVEPEVDFAALEEVLVLVDLAQVGETLAAGTGLEAETKQP